MIPAGSACALLSPYVLPFERSEPQKAEVHVVLKGGHVTATHDASTANCPSVAKVPPEAANSGIPRVMKECQQTLTYFPGVSRLKVFSGALCNTLFNKALARRNLYYSMYLLHIHAEINLNIEFDEITDKHRHPKRDFVQYTVDSSGIRCCTSSSNTRD